MTAQAYEPLYEINDCLPPYEFVELKAAGDPTIPRKFRNNILIHTVHDGRMIPRRFLYRRDEPIVDAQQVDRLFVRERDWGANLVAHKLTEALGIGGYARCRLARVMLDFNRFPGSTPPGVPHGLATLAINQPFTHQLSHPEKLSLLEDYYDGISQQIEGKLIKNRLIMIAVHTYDERNASQTQRPDLSLLTSMAGYQRESRMPYGIFDPLYPDVLGESTCNRILRDRISLNLERTGFRVSHNHPYPLPEGSMEVRAQVWLFFDYLRKRFERAVPESVEDPAYKMVWLMLLNTNLRLHEGEALRSFLHRFRRVPRSQIGRFRKAEVAYARLSSFLADSTVVEDFCQSKKRPSSIGLEVRKDLVCSFDRITGRPLPLTDEQEEKATLIGKVIASAIATYFTTDWQYL